MIILNLKGGLGNQMFQYACGRALSLRNGVPLKLDTTGLQKSLAANTSSDTPRSYGLEAFNITENIATAEEIAKTKYPFGPVSKAFRFFNAKILGRHYVSFSQKIFETDGSAGNIYLDGFFQSEQYFEDVTDQIRTDFTLKNPLSPYSADIMKKITSTETSISLHIRRGDYITTASNAFISLPLSYYKKALAYLDTHTHRSANTGTSTEKNRSTNLFIFSDDIQWVKDNFNLPEGLQYDITFVSTPNTPLHEEITLMSACDHHIIANSSFSWWGAWLDPRPNKIVIAPKVWSKHNESWYKDIIPESWVRL